ncbi:hypothetical protein [Burkholderia cenocepacia]|uniref:hypothetical protein n=1 Tax=Burkholderia cenocepacia TaxID=95486 RepID=UPI00076188E2|nr:hypothetical protein [Burkholderia cenocepacia]KWU26435.1 hypothetical protein AS149_25955 [Burkholderia cenocepacia]
MNKEADLKARDFLLCALAVPALYVLFLLLGILWDVVVAVYQFFAATPTNPASFTFVCFLLTVLAGGFGVAAFRHVEENRPWSIESWKEWRASHYENLRWYGVAILGLLCGVVQIYMVLTMPARPDANTFRAWVCIAGGSVSLSCLFLVVGNFGHSLWMFWRDRPTPVVQR